MEMDGYRGREQERVEATASRITKWQKRALVAVGRGFRVIKTDRQTDRQRGGRGNKKMEGRGRDGGSRMRGDLLKCSLNCDLSTDAQQEAQETIPSDRVATLFADE